VKSLTLGEIVYPLANADFAPRHPLLFFSTSSNMSSVPHRLPKDGSSGAQLQEGILDLVMWDLIVCLGIDSSDKSMASTAVSHCPLFSGQDTD
jgi:hypothetical protein